MTEKTHPPAAPVRPLRIEQLGRVRTDEYAWMKDARWREVLRDPTAIKLEVKAHLEAENAYAAAMLASTEPLQNKIFEEMKGRIKQDDLTVPAPDGPFDYYVRYASGAQHPVHGRRPRGANDGEQVLLDADAEAKGKAFFQVGAAQHSPTIHCSLTLWTSKVRRSAAFSSGIWIAARPFPSRSSPAPATSVGRRT